jgi:hypothetical protein
VSKAGVNNICSSTQLFISNMMTNMHRDMCMSSSPQSMHG